MRFLISCLLVNMFITSCMGTKNMSLFRDVEVIGHRGHVSTYPENTIEGFLSLLETGADGLELDLVISGDNQVVVSHEPYMAASYMLTPDGKRIKKSEEKSYRLYQMTYDSIKSFDSGSRKNPKFPRQKRIPAYKPLLKDVFNKLETRISTENQQPITYYLEMKSAPAEYGISQPFPDEYVELVMEVVRNHNLENRVVFKSFDARLLNSVHSKFPETKISYLLYKTPIDEGLTRLNFKPDIISPNFKQLKKRERVLELQEKEFKVIPWTVNRKRHIKRMMNFGVDGIISDYPEKVLREKEKRNN